MSKDVIRIGTRGSDLALAQAKEVAFNLERVSKRQTEIVVITTTGDKRTTEARENSWDKLDWIKEIEEALFLAKIDMAIHSSKDLPYEISEKTYISSILKRESAYDLCVFKNKSYLSIEELPERSNIGTSSLRRSSQILRIRPDLNVVPHRGNVPTRIEKLENREDLEAIVIAQAGVSRLKLKLPNARMIEPKIMLPAVGQGTLAIQIRNTDSELIELTKALIDKETQITWEAERSFIRTVEANCNSAVAVLAERSLNNLYQITARICSPDGTKTIENSISFESSKASQSGRQLGEKVLKQGAKTLLQ